MITQPDLTVSVGGTLLSVTEGTLTLDESGVFASATLTVPYTDATADLLDPRGKPPRADVLLTQRFSGSLPVSSVTTGWAGASASYLTAHYAGKTAGWISAEFGQPWNAFGIRPSVTRSANLSVRSRTVNHRDATITATLASDEALLIDSGLVSTAGVSPASLTVLSAVQMVLSRVIGTYSLVTTDGAQTISADSAVWQPGVSGWDYLQPICNSAGLRLWCDEQRVWHLAAPTSITQPGQVTLSTSDTVTEASDEVSRDADIWYEAVVIKYSWTDSSNVPHVQYDVAGDGGAGRVLFVEQKDVPYPRAGEAAARLRKLQGQGRVLGIAATIDPTVYPAMAASVTLPDTLQTGYVSAVTWRIAPDNDGMTVTTRGLVDTPAGSWLSIHPTVRWMDLQGTWNTLTWSTP